MPFAKTLPNAPEKNFLHGKRFSPTRSVSRLACAKGEDFIFHSEALCCDSLHTFISDLITPSFVKKIFTQHFAGKKNLVLQKCWKIWRSE